MTHSSVLHLFGLIVFFCISYSKGLEEGCIDLDEVSDVYNPEEVQDKFKVIEVTGEGRLYSPGFKENKDYPDNVICGYHLKAEEDMHIRIHFNDLDIDVSESCSADFVSINEYTSEGEFGGVAEIICGDQKPNDYVSQLSEVQIILKSDEYSSRKGFDITYSVQSTPDYCRDDQEQCRNRKCVDESLVCDGKDDCGDGTDEESCGDDVLPSTECGRPEIDPVTFADFDRIVGGRDAAYGSWPWMAELQMDIIHPNGHVCGGSLINAQWVLTAAHCFNDLSGRSADSWRIHLGNYHKFKKDEGEQIRYADRIILYENIKPEDTDPEEEMIFDIVNDMALIKLNAPVKFTKYVKPICLADLQSKFDNSSTCYSTGWGSTRGTGSSDRLKQAIHPIQPDKYCKEAPEVEEVEFNPDTMVCAGSLLPLNGACHGDSGGPLVCETSKGHWSLVGVTSYITDTNLEEGLCGLKDRPTVFSKVAAKVSWIEKTIESDGDDDSDEDDSDEDDKDDDDSDEDD